MKQRMRVMHLLGEGDKQTTRSNLPPGLGGLDGAVPLAGGVTRFHSRALDTGWGLPKVSVGEPEADSREGIKPSHYGG